MIRISKTMGRMSMIRVLGVLWSIALVFVTSCVTVNIYFPAAEVNRAAEQIVDDVYGKPGNPAGSSGEEQGQRWVGRALAAALEPSNAYAQEDITVTNAVIRGLQEQLAANHQNLIPFYEQGNVGIDKNGYLTLRDTGALPMAQLAALRRLTGTDNSLRRQLYLEVAKALNLQMDQVDRVERVFAAKWKEKAASGWWIQEDDGNWRSK